MYKKAKAKKQYIVRIIGGVYVNEFGESCVEFCLHRRWNIKQKIDRYKTMRWRQEDIVPFMKERLDKKMAMEFWEKQEKYHPHQRPVDLMKKTVTFSNLVCVYHTYTMSYTISYTMAYTISYTMSYTI